MSKIEDGNINEKKSFRAIYRKFSQNEKYRRPNYIRQVSGITMLIVGLPLFAFCWYLKLPPKFALPVVIIIAVEIGYLIGVYKARKKFGSSRK